MSDQSCDGCVAHLLALMQIDLEHGRAVSGDCDNRFVRNKVTLVQFQLNLVSIEKDNGGYRETDPFQKVTVLGDFLKRVICDP